MFFKRPSKKEIEERLFFNFEEIKAKKIKKVERKNFISKKNFFAYTLSELEAKIPRNNLFHQSFSSKQVVVKNLSNLDGIGASRAMDYVIRNSDEDFLINEKGEKKNFNALMSDWKRDFTNKKNAKEVWHLSFSIDERKTERNLKILEESVREVLEKNFFEYKYAYVLHTHQNKPHIHVLINKNNQFTKKKLHLQKDEFKDFFTTLRNDFAFALNLRGLEYHNHFKLEKDLKRQKERLGQYEIFSQNAYDELIKLEEDLQRKIEMKEKKIQKEVEELKRLYDEKNNKLLKEISALKKLDEKHKKLYAFFRKLKNINMEIKKLQNEIKMLRNEITLMKKDKYHLMLEKDKYERYKDEQILKLEKKKALLFFYKNKLENKNLSKRALNTIKELEMDIDFYQNEGNKILQDKIKSALMTSALLSKKNNAFDLIKSHKELQRNLNFLRQGKFEGDGFKKIELRLKNNQEVIENFMEDCFKNLEKDLKHNPKFSKVKEFEKISQYLVKNNDEEIEKLYALFNKKVENKKEVSSGGGNKKKETKEKQEIKENLYDKDIKRV